MRSHNLLVIILCVISICPSQSWRQIGGNPQHTSYTPNKVGTGKHIQNLFEEKRVADKTSGLLLSSTELLYTTGVSGTRVYAICMFTNGRVAWAERIGSSGEWFADISHSPALSNDESVVYYSYSEMLYAYNADDGELLWNITSPTGVPTITSSGTIIVAGASSPVGNIAAYSPSGKLLWQSKANDDKLRPCALDETEQVCVAGTAEYRDEMKIEVQIYGYSALNGTLLWASKKYRYGRVNISFSYAMIYKGIAYAALVGYGWIGVDVYTGKILFDNLVSEFVDVTAAPALVHVNGTVYSIFGYRTGFDPWYYSFCLADMKSGKNLKCTRDTIDGEVSTQVVVTADGVAIFGVDGWGLRGYNIATGEMLWSFEHYTFYTQPVIASDGSIYAVDPYGYFHAMKVNETGPTTTITPSPTPTITPPTS